MSLAKPRALSPPATGQVAGAAGVRQRGLRDRASLLVNESSSSLDRRRNRSGVGMDTISELEKVRTGDVEGQSWARAADCASLRGQVGSWHTPQKMRHVPPPSSRLATLWHTIWAKIIPALYRVHACAVARLTACAWGCSSAKQRYITRDTQSAALRSNSYSPPPKSPTWAQHAEALAPMNWMRTSSDAKLAKVTYPETSIKPLVVDSEVRSSLHMRILAVDQLLTPAGFADSGARQVQI